MKRAKAVFQLCDCAHCIFIVGVLLLHGAREALHYMSFSFSFIAVCIYNKMKFTPCNLRACCSLRAEQLLRVLFLSLSAALMHLKCAQT
jgi:hypothetical protein